MSDRKYLVTGASGKLGSAVVEQLLSSGALTAQQLIVTTRDRAKLSSLVELGVDVREANFSDPSSLEQAFAGANSLLLVSIDLSAGSRTQPHLNAVNAAKKAGVDHLIYTSMPAPSQSPVMFAHEHEATEAAIVQSGIENTVILRNNWYFENLPEYFASTLQTGHWLTSAGNGKTAQLSRRDLAMAAVAALVKAPSGHQVLTLNGPESLTNDEMAHIMDRILGTSINMVHLSDDEFRSQLTSFQLPEPVIELCVTMDQHNRGFFSDGSSDEFVALTGSQPQTFEQWLTNHRTELRKLANLDG